MNTVYTGQLINIVTAGDKKAIALPAIIQMCLDQQPSGMLPGKPLGGSVTLQGNCCSAARPHVLDAQPLDGQLLCCICSHLNGVTLRILATYSARWYGYSCSSSSSSGSGSGSTHNNSRAEKSPQQKLQPMLTTK
jgi:hypothetical protein